MRISKPMVSELINGYQFMWCEGDEWVMSVKVTRLIDDKRGSLSGVLSVEHEFENKPTVSGIRFNMLSLSARNSIIKRLIEANLVEDFDWSDLVNQICVECIERHEKGEPAHELWINEDEEVQPPEYLIDPILLKGVPTVIFGEKGAAKSTLSAKVN